MSWMLGSVELTQSVSQEIWLHLKPAKRVKRVEKRVSFYAILISLWMRDWLKRANAPETTYARMGENIQEKKLIKNIKYVQLTLARHSFFSHFNFLFPKSWKLNANIYFGVPTAKAIDMNVTMETEWNRNWGHATINLITMTTSGGSTWKIVERELELENRWGSRTCCELSTDGTW